MGDDNMNKKKKDENSRSRTSTIKKLANSFNPSGPPPEPPARPAPREQSNVSEEEANQHPPVPALSAAPVMSDVIKELGTKSGTLRRASNSGKLSQCEDQPVRFNASNVHQRPPAPLPVDYSQQTKLQQKPERSGHPLMSPGHENGVKHVPATPFYTSSKPLPFTPQNKPLPPQSRQPVKKTLSSFSPTHLPDNEEATAPLTDGVKPKQSGQQATQCLKKPKQAKGAAKPSPTQAKTENVTTEGDKPRSPAPRPRNRPPPPPPPGSLKESGKSTSNSSLSSSDTNLSEPSSDSRGPSPRPRPVPRPRYRTEQQSAGIDRDHGTLNQDGEKVIAAPMSSTGNKPNFSRQPSLTSRPVHPPPAIPGHTKKPGGSSANQQKAPVPATKPLSAGPRQVPSGSKPKPPIKPQVPRRPKITPPSFEPDPRLSPQVNEILKLSNRGQTKVKEILSLTDARVIDNSQINLLEVVSELQKITSEVLESSSSLTDSLGPQARFTVRRTVTDLESKYSDMEGLMRTVGPNPNAVDMERIGKVVHSFSGSLDSICSTVRAAAS